MLARQIQKGHHHDRDWSDDQKHDSGHCRRLRLGNHYPRHGDRPLPHPDLCSAPVCSLQGCRTIEEQFSQDHLPKVSRREEQALGWGVLGRRLLYDDCRQGAEHRAGEVLHREAGYDDSVMTIPRLERSGGRGSL